MVNRIVHKIDVNIEYNDITTNNTIEYYAVYRYIAILHKNIIKQLNTPLLFNGN